MSQGPDLTTLSPEARRLVEAERAARLKAEAEVAEFKAYTQRLEHLIKEFQRARFGRSSEKLDPDQREMAFEDIETAIGETQAAQDDADASGGDDDKPRRPGKRKRGQPRALPKHLPRDEETLEPADITCPCGCGEMVRIGEDRASRLDITPAQFRIKETIRPRYACPHGRSGVVQAHAPAHLIEGGLPTEALLAHVIVAKYSEHMPLYRQAQVFARHGVAVDRSSLADWVGGASFHLAPVVDRLNELLKQSDKLFMDETVAPVLDPGRGRTKTGYLWALARDDRPWGGPDPPGVVFHYRDGRAGAKAEAILEGFDGILQVDGYGGYRRLARGNRTGGAPVTLAYCWAHARREIIKATPRAGSPVARAALEQIAALYRIEAEIRGEPPETRKAVRQARSKPLVEELGAWLAEQRRRLSAKSKMGEALAYAANHWDGLCVFLDDGRVEMDSNPVENAIRPVPLNRKNALFAGHDEGAAGWARMASLIGTCKLNDVEPYAYMKATLEALAAGHPKSRLDELLPWNFQRATPTA